MATIMAAAKPKSKSKSKSKSKPQILQPREGNDQEEEEEESLRLRNPLLSRDPNVCLAIYIAMAHAGLALTLALLYGVTLLLEEYWRPIQWALLCSMPLRQLHTTLVSFWGRPLRLGLLPTLLAIPFALLRSAAASLLDSHAALLRLFRRRRSPSSSSSNKKRRSRIGFSKLMQWLVSFGAFVLLHERIGLLSLPVFLVSGFVSHASGSQPQRRLVKTLSAISSVWRRNRRSRASVAALARPPFYSRLGRYLTSFVLNRLNTLVAVSLIIIMIIGSISALLFFSYKIGIEGKDTVISLKTHMEVNRYSERIGLQQWMDNHDVPEMIESWTTNFYESVSQYVDSVALQYNATEIVDGFRHYLIRPLESHFNNASSSSSSSSMVYEKVPRRPASGKLRRLIFKFRNQEWKVICDETYGLFTEFLSVIATEDLVEKLKGFALQSIDVSRRVFASSTMVVSGSANLVFRAALSIISGAAGLLNFVSQLTVFFWLLYYLIASESGGRHGSCS